MRDCEIFTGTAATLAAGQTLVVSQHNLAAGRAGDGDGRVGGW